MGYTSTARLIVSDAPILALMATTSTRAQGVLFGQLIGDSLGSLVEFRTAETIAREYPNGVRELADGGPFQLKAR